MKVQWAKRKNEKVKPEDYEEPRKGWVPEDPKLRFEHEGSAYMPKFELPKPKGRPVVLSPGSRYSAKWKTIREWQNHRFSLTVHIFQPPERQGYPGYQV